MISDGLIREDAGMRRLERDIELEMQDEYVLDLKSLGFQVVF